jgi:hypothetical protein
VTMVEPKRAPWRCRHGWHRYAFVSMSDVRMIDIPGHAHWVCRLVEQCVRCGIRLTTKAATVPMHPRVETVREAAARLQHSDPSAVGGEQ